MGTRALSLGVKWPGHEADHPPPYRAEVKECVELYIHSPNTPSWRDTELKSTGTTLPWLSLRCWTILMRLGHRPWVLLGRSRGSLWSPSYLKSRKVPFVMITVCIEKYVCTVIMIWEQYCNIELDFTAVMMVVYICTLDFLYTFQ